MLSSEQIGFLSAFPDFKVKHDSTPAIVFTELATLRKWKVGGRKHTKYYEAFFKYHDDSSDSSSEEGSRVIISRALSEDSSSQDEHESIVGQLEGSLKHLRLNTSTFGPAMNSQTTASLRSRSDGAGVKVRYFDSFQGFMPNNQAPIKQEFARLALQQGWKRENGMLVKHTVYHKQMLRCYSEELFFHSRGSLPYLAVLQGLCADLRVTTVPGSVKACKNVCTV